MFKAHREDLLRAVGARRGRRSELHAFSDGHLESLESRTLMSALTYAEFADRFNIAATIHDLQQPGAEFMGFGYAATALGDINNDGFGDFAVSAPGSPFNSEGPVVPGSVFLFSGQDGSMIRTLTEGVAGYGSALASIGDVNNDGVADLLIASSQFDANSDDTPEQFGRAWVYSGADGSLIRTHTGATAGDEFGLAIAALGDLNADGVAEYAVASPGASGSRGQVVIYSGIDGAALHTLNGEAAGHRFGASLVSAGDVGAAPGLAGDGISDILVGAPGTPELADYAGKIYLFNGADAALRWSLAGETAGDAFGTAIAVTNPRTNEVQIYVGAPGADPIVGMAHVNNAGAVYRVGQDGVLEDSIDGSVAESARGTTLRMIGDIDGDGVMDIAFSTPGDAAQHSRIISGFGGFEIAPHALSADLLRESVFALGDVNHDGYADLGVLNAAGDHFTVVSSLAVSPPTTFDITSENLQYIFNSGAEGRRIGIVNGQLVSLGSINGLLATDRVVAVNNAGHFVVVAEAEGADAIYIVRDGVRTRLQDAVSVTPTNPAPNYSTFQVVRFSNSGDILFNDLSDPGDDASFNRAWLLHGSTLTYLWDGVARDINASGQIIGVRTTNGNQEAVLRSADGQVGAVGLSDAWRINDDGLVVGTDANANLATWQNGETNVIGDVDAPEGTTGNWIVRGVNANGQVLATFRTSTGGDLPTVTDTDYLFDPEDGLQPLYEVTFDVDPGETPRFDPAVAIGADGTILTQHGVLTPVADDAPWVGAEGTPIWNSATADARVIAGINQFGDVVVLRREGDAWRASRLDVQGLFSLPTFNISNVLAATDASGTSHVFIVSDQGSYVATLPTEHQRLVAANRLDTADTRITGHSTVFVSADGRIHLAGTMNNGDLAIFFQPDAQASPQLFVFDNLTTTHIESQGGTFAPVAGNLTALVANWGASHLFYLDNQGGLHSVWIAPGMTYWASTDLTAAVAEGGIAAHPELALSGEITAYGTPWNGLNVVGEGTDGRPTAIWWVPQFEGSWRHDPIYGFDGQPDVPFNPESSTSYTTPWGGLNVATIQDSGDVAVFWWVPGFDQWRGEVLTIADRPEGLTFNGDISASVVGEELNLFARGSDGDLYRLFWNPGDEGTWHLQNLTESVA